MAADAQMCSTVIFVASVTRRLRVVRFAVPGRCDNTLAVSIIGGKKVVFDLVDAPVGVVVTKVDQLARVLGREQQIAHQVRTRCRIPSQAADEILDEIGHVLLVLRRHLGQVH